MSQSGKESPDRLFLGEKSRPGTLSQRSAWTKRSSSLASETRHANVALKPSAPMARWRELDSNPHRRRERGEQIELRASAQHARLLAVQGDNWPQRSRRKLLAPPPRRRWESTAQASIHPGTCSYLISLAQTLDLQNRRRNLYGSTRQSRVAARHDAPRRCARYGRRLGSA